MKKGDRVRIFDGSWSMVYENGSLGDGIGTILIADGPYEVVSTNPGFLRNFPVSKSAKHYHQKNNICLRCIKNPGRIVYTQSRFCSVI